MTIRQLPSFAFRSPADYATAMDAIHVRYDPVLGVGLVGLLERAQVFQVFSSWWFSASLVVLTISIVCCTLDRTPRLWRQGRDIRVTQPDPFYDPRLPDRAAMDGLTPDAVRAVLRANRFGVRVETAEGGATYLYGDRHRWTKLATLFTHTRAHPVPASRPRSRAGSASSRGSSWPSGETPDRPADRDAGPARRQEPRVRGARLPRPAGSPTSPPTWPSTGTAASSPARPSG